MKPRNAIIMAALLAVALWANALTQTTAAPAGKSDAKAACCKGKSAKDSCCKEGKCDEKGCCKGADCKDCCGKDAKDCCAGTDGKSCPMMAKSEKSEGDKAAGCCRGASCPMHGHSHSPGK